MSDTSVDEDDNGDNNDTLHTPLPHVDGQPVSFTPSAGTRDSVDALKDADTPVHESASSAQTRWNPEEGNGRKWARLKELDDTTQAGDDYHQQQRDASLRRRDLRTAASRLELPTPCVEQALSLLNAVDFRELGSIRSEAVILGALTLAVNADDRAIRPTTVSAITDALDDGDSAVSATRGLNYSREQTALYTEIRDAWNVTHADVTRARRRVRNAN
jgi:hypothetical protein